MIKITDSNYTHILAIVDRSGSMHGVASDMEGALNQYFEDQAKVKGVALVDYVQFDTVYETVFSDTPVADARAVIQPRGGTALLDAIGLAGTALGAKLAKLPESRRPGAVQVVIVTDGYENSSVEWTYFTVKAFVEEQTAKWKWDFVFLGANIDAVAVGATFGIQRDKALTFNIHNGESVVATAGSLSNYTTQYRAAGAAAAGFSDEDRENANK